MAGRRQVLSYSDSFAAPSGDVDFEQPLPSLVAGPQQSIAGPSSSSRKGKSKRDSAKRSSHGRADPPQPPLAQTDAVWGPPAPPLPPPLSSLPYQPPPPPSVLGVDPPPPGLGAHYAPGYARASPFGPSVNHQHHAPPPHALQPPPPAPTHYNHLPAAVPGRPYYTGPPPGFGPGFGFDGQAHPHPAPQQQHPVLPQYPPSAPAAMRPPPMAPSRQQSSFSTPFLASPMAYHAAVNANGGASTSTSTASYIAHQPPFTWPGSDYYEKSTVVIEDWDFSSDEDGDEEEQGEEEDEHADKQHAPSPPADSSRRLTLRERRSLAKQARQIHNRNVHELFAKANGKSVVGPSADAENTAPSLPSTQDQSLLEKKQAEIKAMLERIKKLEAGRSKSNGGVKLATAVSTGAGSASASPTVASGTASPAVEANPTGVVAAPLLANQNGEGVRADPSTAQPPPSASSSRRVLDPALAEQRRKLLESMSARSKKATTIPTAAVAETATAMLPLTTESTPDPATPAFVIDTTPTATTTTAATTMKRKADTPPPDEDEDNGGDDDEAGTVTATDAAAPSLVGKKAKRQRKKERRRLAATVAAAEAGDETPPPPSAAVAEAEPADHEEGADVADEFNDPIDETPAGTAPPSDHEDEDDEAGPEPRSVPKGKKKKRKRNKDKDKDAVEKDSKVKAKKDKKKKKRKAASNSDASDA